MRDGNTPLDQEYARRGLARPATVERVLGIDHEAYRFFIDQHQLKPVMFEWKGGRKWGIPLAQFENAAAVYRNGVLRLTEGDR